MPKAVIAIATAAMNASIKTVYCIDASTDIPLKECCKVSAILKVFEEMAIPITYPAACHDDKLTFSAAVGASSGSKALNGITKVVVDT